MLTKHGVVTCCDNIVCDFVIFFQFCKFSYVFFTLVDQIEVTTSAFLSANFVMLFSPLLAMKLRCRPGHRVSCTLDNVVHEGMVSSSCPRVFEALFVTLSSLPRLLPSRGLSSGPSSLPVVPVRPSFSPPCGPSPL